MIDSKSTSDLPKVLKDPNSSDQLLLLSADTMMRYAQKYCRHTNLAGSQSSCEWYHAPWQYARLVGLIATPDFHADFYAQSFTEAVNSGSHNILISGTADYGILDHLVKAIPKNLLDNINISILDLCRTPLEICKWYGRWYEENSNVHLNLRCIQGNALSTGYRNHAFDMITTYQFFSRFKESERAQLVSEWYRILKPGGKVITSDHISPEYKLSKIVGVGGDKDFVKRLKKHIEERKPWLRTMTKTIINLAKNFTRNQVEYPIPSIEYFHQLFHNFDCTIKPAISQNEFESPKDYARIMAIKK